jgi:hypothetical protein
MLGIDAPGKDAVRRFVDAANGRSSGVLAGLFDGKNAGIVLPGGGEVISAIPSRRRGGVPVGRCAAFRLGTPSDQRRDGSASAGVIVTGIPFTTALPDGTSTRSPGVSRLLFTPG